MASKLQSGQKEAKGIREEEQKGYWVRDLRIRVRIRIRRR
jgi:hypothetical protein